MAEKKKSGFSLRKLIYNDKYLIIMSILLAIVVWCATSINYSPETNKTITVPVAVDFTDSAASQLGIKCYGEASIDVDVTISCKKYLAKDITADDINIYLQTNTVTSNGNIEVPIKVESGNNFSIVSYYPNSYRAFFDVEEEKVMDIDVNYVNEDFIEEGYVKGEAILSENSVTVKGPKTYVSQVDRIASTVKFENKIKSTQTVELNLSPVNRAGDEIDYISCITKNDNVTLTIPVLKKTTLDVTSSFIGKPPKVNASDFTVKYSVNTVNAGVLEEAELKKANIGNIDFSKLTVGNNEIKFNTNTMESFAILDNIEEITATVTVPDTYSTKTVYINGANVDITNIPSGYKAEVVSLNTYSVTAVGSKENLAGISSSNVRLLVDFSSQKDNIKEGVASYNLSATLDNSDTSWIYGDYSAAIRIYK